MDYLVFGSYLDVELLIFYDSLKLRFGDYENFVSTWIVLVCNLFGYWILVDGCLVLKLSFEDFRILSHYSEQVFDNW